MDADLRTRADELDRQALALDAQADQIAETALDLVGPTAVHRCGGSYTFAQSNAEAAELNERADALRGQAAELRARADIG